MKNIMFKLIPLLLVLGCVFSLSACGMFGGSKSSVKFSDTKPELDFDDAADNLEDADYIVDLDDEDVEPGVKQTLSAYDEDGNRLYMTEFEDSKMAKLTYEAMLVQAEAQADYINAQIELLEYQLKEYEDDMKSSEIDDLEDAIKEMEDELEELEDYTIGVSGKVFWYGTAKAAKASK